MSAEKVESKRAPKKGNPGEYREGKIWVSTGKVGSERVPEMYDPGEYRRRMGSLRLHFFYFLFFSFLFFFLFPSFRRFRVDYFHFL